MRKLSTVLLAGLVVTAGAGAALAADKTEISV